MCKPISPEIAEVKYSVKDIFDLYWSDYLTDSTRKFHLEDYHLKVINTVRCCQTARLGLYEFSCISCGDSHQLPRSCKQRFCSTCGTADTHNWIGKLSLKLPDINHHHVVFTLPKGLRGLCRRNKVEIYNLLFQCSQEVLKEEFWLRHKLLPGIISVLHTNGSDLKYHPHVHMIVSGGGLTKGGEVEQLRKDYLFSQRYLANKFRDLFLARLSKMLDSGDLDYSESFGRQKGKFIKSLGSEQWIVNVDKSLPGVEKIVSYVGRYTKKSCISERRIKSISGGRITISYKDYKNSKRGEKPKESQLTMSSTEFLDRYMEHMPEKGYKVVRYYGLYSGSNLKKIPQNLRLQELNGEKSYDFSEMEEVEIELCPFKKYRKQVYQRTGKDPLYCYSCHQSMKLIEVRYESKNGELKTVKVYDSG